jgi:hypothetical protein
VVAPGSTLMIIHQTSGEHAGGRAAAAARVYRQERSDVAVQSSASMRGPGVEEGGLLGRKTDKRMCG